jgi:hypothetical protein
MVKKPFLESYFLPTVKDLTAKTILTRIIIEAKIKGAPGK